MRGGRRDPDTNVTFLKWEYIAELTGDNSFKADAMREYFKQVEKCNYLPPGTPGHGFDGFITVSYLFPVRFRCMFC